jgi:hypothetical protein
LLGARQGVSVVTDSVESVKAASGARVQSELVSWLVSWPWRDCLRVALHVITLTLVVCMFPGRLLRPEGTGTQGDPHPP